MVSVVECYSDWLTMIDLEILHNFFLFKSPFERLRPCVKPSCVARLISKRPDEGHQFLSDLLQEWEASSRNPQLPRGPAHRHFTV